VISPTQRPLSAHSALTRDRNPFPTGFKTHSPNKREVADRHLRPRNYWAQPSQTYICVFGSEITEGMQKLLKGLMDDF